MNIEMSERDFDRLSDNSMRWSGTDWQAQEDRFETSDNRLEEINWDFKMAYWIGDNPAAIILAREYVRNLGFDSQILWDMAEYAENEYYGYVLLTDYETESWKGR